jgi:hypothetical protein
MEKEEIVRAVKSRGCSRSGDSFYTPAIAVVLDASTLGPDGGLVDIETWHFNGDPHNPEMKTMKVPAKSYGDDSLICELVARNYFGKPYRDPSNIKAIEIYRDL